MPRVAALIMLCLVPTLNNVQSEGVEIWLRAFIPNPANAGQSGGHIVPIAGGNIGSAVRLVNIDRAFFNECFATDHRGFSNSNASTARLETRFTLTLASNSIATVAPAQSRTTAGVTKKVDCSNGAVLQQAVGTVNRDHLGAPAVADGVVQVIGQVQGRNVLTLVGANGPAIDYSFDIKWKPSTRTLTAEVTFGEFPAFEMYARRAGGAWVPVIRALPTGTVRALTADSFGINSTRQVSTVTLP